MANYTRTFSRPNGHTHQIDTRIDEECGFDHTTVKISMPPRKTAMVHIFQRTADKQTGEKRCENKTMPLTEYFETAQGMRHYRAMLKEGIKIPRRYQPFPSKTPKAGG